MNKIFKWSLIGTAVLITAVALLPSPEVDPGKAASSPSATRLVLKVTAPELLTAYEANEAAAQAKYGSSILQVTGMVQAVDLNLFNKPVVRFSTGNEFSPATVNLVEDAQSKAQTLSKGQKLTVTCQSVSEAIGSPQLQDCEF